MSKGNRKEALNERLARLGIRHDYLQPWEHRPPDLRREFLRVLQEDGVAEDVVALAGLVMGAQLPPSEEVAPPPRRKKPAERRRAVLVEALVRRIEERGPEQGFVLSKAEMRRAARVGSWASAKRWQADPTFAEEVKAVNAIFDRAFEENPNEPPALWSEAVEALDAYLDELGVD